MGRAPAVQGAALGGWGNATGGLRPRVCGGEVWLQDLFLVFWCFALRLFLGFLENGGVGGGGRVE